MKEKMKKVYYCDYCKKKMFVRSAMEEHELRCTANINRHCRMCDFMGMGTGNDIKDIIEKTEKMLTRKHTLCMDNENDKKIFEEVFDLVSGCPACILTVMRHHKIIVDGWNFKEAMQKEFDSVREEEMSYIF